jgi:hypothetical protein
VNGKKGELRGGGLLCLPVFDKFAEQNAGGKRRGVSGCVWRRRYLLCFLDKPGTCVFIFRPLRGTKSKAEGKLEWRACSVLF